MKTSLYVIGNKSLGPVLQNYVIWVLKNAEKRNIKILYFLARDGFLLYKIAEIFCKKFNLKIECRYLYCSRYALRMPTYHFINIDEREALIFANSNEITLKSIFARIGFDSEDVNTVLLTSNLDMYVNKKLNYIELLKVKNELIQNKKYQDLLKKKSLTAYENIIEYFKQEQLFDYEHIGIVDSGWTGSMQHSLKQIMQQYGAKIKITGFYFGLFTNKNAEKDDEFCSWYFSPQKNFWHKVLFCNNVLECMLSAPHEMTVGYQKVNNKWIPVFKNTGNKTLFYALVNEQIKGCIDYINANTNEFIWQSYDDKRALENTFKLLRIFMVFPKKGEVDAYNKFMFCDDVSEAYSQALADKSQVKLLANYLIIPRMVRKLTNKKINAAGLFWAYGTASYLTKYKRWWYRINIIVWEALRYLLK